MKTSNFSSLTCLLLFIISKITIAQAQWNFTGGNTVILTTQYMGTDGSSTSPLQLKTIETGANALPINFFTNNTQRATILGNNGSTDGFVGIGDASLGTSFGSGFPAWRLDVDLGDINLNQTNATISEAYRIDGDRVLWHNTFTSNIFCGVGAGATNTTTSGVNNTFVGNNAGASNSSGFSNTFSGKDAGYLNTTGRRNNFYGDSAGYNNSKSGVRGNANWFGGFVAGFANDSGSYNTYTGHRAGRLNPNGNYNSFYGKEAGDDSRWGEHNCFYGYHSGLVNGKGSSESIDENCFFGSQSGESNISGARNCFYGALSGNLNVKGYENVAIGQHAAINMGAAGAGSDHGNVYIGADVANNFNSSLEGDSNVIIGVRAGATGSSPLVNAIAIGADATVRHTNHMILGNNLVNVGIGLSADATGPTAKLHVVNSVNTTGILSRTSTSGTAINIGVNGITTNSTRNIGVKGQTSTGMMPSPLNSLQPYSTGAAGQAQGSTIANYGGVFQALGNCATNYGIYAGAQNLNPFCTLNSYSGYFQGININIGGTLVPSDSTLKDSIIAISDALNVILRLHPKSFVFKDSLYPYMNLPIGKQYGLISQEVDTVIPELVHDFMQPEISDSGGTVLQDTMTVKGMDYNGLIPFVIKGVQEQQHIIDSLEGDKVSAEGDPTTADSNRVTKWTAVNKILKSSQIYDSGTEVGIPNISAGSYFNVANTADTVAVNVTSTDSTTARVVKAVYNTDGNVNNVSAVYGYSKYTDHDGNSAGLGGQFEGGFGGVFSVGNGSNYTEVGVAGLAENAGFLNVGVLGLANKDADSINCGVLGTAEHSDYNNVGVTGTAAYSSPTARNVGILGFASGSEYENRGGAFTTEDTIGVRYGITADVNGSAPNAYAGYFNGDLHVNGNVTWTSDQNLKNNIEDINKDSAAALLSRLEPKTYQYRTTPNMSLPRGKQYGLLAQDVQHVLPELVSDIVQPEKRDKDGRVVYPEQRFLGLNYVGIIPLLVTSAKQSKALIDEQKEKIDSLENVINNRLNALESRIMLCCGGGSGKADDNTNRTTIELSNLQAIVLDQNAPNPFAEQTTIRYYIPDDVQSAQMVFYDITGRLLKTADVQKGYGIVTVFAPNLSSGTYTYSLIADGKEVETKRMVKGK